MKCNGFLAKYNLTLEHPFDSPLSNNTRHELEQLVAESTPQETGEHDIDGIKERLNQLTLGLCLFL